MVEAVTVSREELRKMSQMDFERPLNSDEAMELFRYLAIELESNWSCLDI